MLLETIKIQNQKVYNIEYHNKRLNLSRYKLFGVSSSIDLNSYINIQNDNKLYRCRILYDRDIIKIEYIPYTPKNQQNFIIIDSDIEYDYKFSNRDELNILKENYSKYDDIIISQNGLLKDTTIANIAFLDNGIWITPMKPLLYGTMRAKMIDDNMLVARDINIREINKYSGFAIMNAMVGFKIIKTPSIRRKK